MYLRGVPDDPDVGQPGLCLGTREKFLFGQGWWLYLAHSGSLASPLLSYAQRVHDLLNFEVNKGSTALKQLCTPEHLQWSLGATVEALSVASTDHICLDPLTNYMSLSYILWRWMTNIKFSSKWSKMVSHGCLTGDLIEILHSLHESSHRVIFAKSSART